MDPSLHVTVHRGFYFSYHKSQLRPRIRAAVEKLVEEHTGWFRCGGARLVLNAAHTLQLFRCFATCTTSCSRSGVPSLLVAGHSLGGALAQVAAIDLFFNVTVTPVSVHTFGSPRVGNQDFGKVKYGAGKIWASGQSPDALRIQQVPGNPKEHGVRVD